MKNTGMYGHNYSGTDKNIPCKKCGKIHVDGMLGLHPKFTLEHKQRIGKSNTCLNNWMYGRTGKDAPRYGKTPPLSTWGKCGKRTDLNNQYFRSTWESNFARILNYWNIPWIYEPIRFYFDDSTYLPDFLLVDDNTYVEIMWKHSENKMKKLYKFNEQYPYERLTVIDEPVYESLEKEFRLKLPGWEN
jgi:hypothetical protein